MINMFTLPTPRQKITYTNNISLPPSYTIIHAAECASAGASILAVLAVLELFVVDRV